MIATAWLCTVLTLLCATKLVYTAPRGSYDGYPLDDMDTNMLQNDYFLSKRNKPSLSIVNPLDVLRQRLLLEIARRQMKENTRQVELNRAILKNVGKRMLSKHPYPLAATLFDIKESQQQQQQQMQQEPMQQLPYDLELIPTTLIFEYLQQQQHQRRPWLPYESTAIQFDNLNNINDAIVEDDGDDDVDNEVGNDVEKDNISANGILVSNQQHSMMKHSKQSNTEQANTFTNEHETALKKPINRNNANKVATLLNHHKNDLNDVNSAHENLNFLNVNNNHNNNDANNNNNNNQSAADYQVQRYLYHLHKNHLTRK